MSIFDSLDNPQLEQSAPAAETVAAAEVQSPEATSPAPDATAVETQVSIEVPASEPAPEPDPVFPLPGQGERPVDEADWLRQQYAQTLTQLQAVQNQLQEMQFKDLPEEERAAAQQQQRVAQLEQYVAQMQEQAAIQEWQNYWVRFLPEEAAVVKTLVDPVQMGHHVVTKVVLENRRLKAAAAAKDTEILALKKAAGVPQRGPEITTNNTGGNASKLTFRDLVKDNIAFDALMQKAQMGTLREEDIPSLS